MLPKSSRDWTNDKQRSRTVDTVLAVSRRGAPLVGNSDNRIPIQFYLEFFERDWPSFPSSVQKKLGDFLEELATNPESPDLLAKCQREDPKEERFAFLVGGEYAVYWHLVREDPPDFIGLSSYKVKMIEVLAVIRFSQ